MKRKKNFSFQAVSRAKKSADAASVKSSMIKICSYLDVSKSWYYDTKTSMEKVQQYEQQIVSKVLKIRKENQSYGTRKIWHQLARDGTIIGRDKLHKILLKYNLTQPKHRKKVRTTFPGMYAHSFHNLIKDLTVDHKDQVWCTDITCIYTTEGILYVSAMMDLFSRKIISFNVSNNLRTEGSLDCLNKALKQVSNPKGIIHHSDHGVQYCSGRYLNALLIKRMQVSFTGPNHCYDNAKIERFFNTLKYEYGLNSVIRTKKLAIQLIKNAVQNYNYTRLHAAINYMIPCELYDAA